VAPFLKFIILYFTYNPV